MKVLFCPGSDYFQKILIDVALSMPDVTSRFLGNTWSDGHNVRGCGFEYAFMPFTFSSSQVQNIPALHEFTVRGFTRNRMPALIRKSFYTFSDFVEFQVADFKPDLIICGAMEYAGSYVLSKIAKKENIVCVGMQTSFIANHLIIHSHGDNWIDHFRCQDVSDVNEDGYLSSIKLAAKNPRRDNSSERFRFLMPWWLRILERALRIILRRPSFDDSAYLLNVIKSKINHREWFPKIDTLRSDKNDFVLVALNQPSIPSSWDIPTWLELIYFSMKAIPENIPIVIRPHPNEPSLKEPECLNEMLQNRNVSISRPGSGPELASLIDKCRAVITMNSAVGMEALLAGKPVFTLAPAFYARSGMAHAVSLSDYEYVRDIILDAKSHTPDHSVICKFTSWIINDFIVSLSCHSNRNSLSNRVKKIINELKECK